MINEETGGSVAGSDRTSAEMNDLVIDGCVER